MKKIYIDKEQELTDTVLTRLIRYFEQYNLPTLQRYKGYYDGWGQDIMRRVVSDDTKPNNKIVKNYCKAAVDNFRGYIAGNPITYTSDEDIAQLLECFKDNNVECADSEFLKNALIYGTAYELCYVNEGNEKKFKNIDSTNVIPVYSADLDEDLLYVIYYCMQTDWTKDGFGEKYDISIYDSSSISHYVADSSLTNFTPCGVEAHHFSTVPFVVFNLTDDNVSIFDCVMGLQDAYNKLLSDEVNDFESFVDSYLVLKDVVADSEDLQKMKESRTILIDGDSDVSYLTKNISDTQIQNLLDNINSSIHTISNSPDFSSEEFNQGVSSGIALQYKLLGFNNIASNIEAQFKRALNRRIDLLNSIFRLVNSVDYDVEIKFTHNLPVNLSDISSNVNILRGLVSDETLLSLLPFVKDPEAEHAKVMEDSLSKYDAYDFGGGDAEEIN